MHGTIPLKPPGIWRQGWYRFRRNRGGMLGLILVALVVLVALICFIAAPYDPNDPELGNRFHFPRLGLTLRRVKLPQGPNDAEGQFFTSLTLARPVPGG